VIPSANENQRGSAWFTTASVSFADINQVLRQGRGCTFAGAGFAAGFAFFGLAGGAQVALPYFDASSSKTRLSFQIIDYDLRKQLKGCNHIHFLRIKKPLNLQAVHDCHDQCRQLFQVNIRANLGLD